jgi:hypothetical protein
MSVARHRCINHAFSNGGIEQRFLLAIRAELSLGRFIGQLSGQEPVFSTWYDQE